LAEANVFYRAKRAADLANPVVETMFTRADTPAAGQPVFTVLPASGKVEGKGVYVAARGVIVAGAGENITLALRIGSTVAGTLLASSGAVATGGAGNFQYELIFEGIWDSTSQALRGRMSGFIGGTAVALTINSGLISGFDPNGSVDMQVILTALFGTSNAGNIAQLRELVTGLD
jgi:hypothetical protein